MYILFCYAIVAFIYSKYKRHYDVVSASIIFTSIYIDSYDKAYMYY